MTEKMAAFLEEAGKDEALIEALENIEKPEDLIALASQKGFELTEEDLDMELLTGEMSDDELDDVAGGFMISHVVTQLVPRIGIKNLRMGGAMFGRKRSGRSKASTLVHNSKNSYKASNLIFDGGVKLTPTTLVHYSGDDDDDSSTLISL